MNKPRKKRTTIPASSPTRTISGQEDTAPIPTPREQESKSPVQEESSSQESPSGRLEGWNWLPTEASDVPAKTVVVKSPLYQVTFSTVGGTPFSWKLLQYKELYSKKQDLELRAKKGSLQQQQVAQLELERMNDQGENGPTFVEAIDSVFPKGKSGFHIRWGEFHSDADVPYTCLEDQVEVKEEVPVRFVYESQGLRIEKTYRFFPDSYHLDFSIRITNQSGNELQFGEEGYYDFLWLGGFGYPSLRKDAQNNVLFQREGSTTIKPVTSLLKEIQKGPLLRDYPSSKTQLLYENRSVGWIGVGQKYFLSSIIPAQPTKTILQGFSAPSRKYALVQKPLMGLRMEVNAIDNGKTLEDKYKLYIGPINEDDLSKADPQLVEARQIFLRTIIGPIAAIMLRLLQGLYLIVPNYGLAIIVLTLLMKILMFPIYQKQIRTTKKMQALQPQINALKEKYKKEPQKLQKEQMELFRKNKVNPLSGCLTMLTTIPVFIALYATFAMAVELRGAPFFGWIQDLSAPDSAFFVSLGSFVIPINILPIAYAVLMLWNMSQQSMEGPNAAVMKIMPMIFVFIFWNIASGVILYFVVSILLDVSQRLLMDKIKGKEPLPEK